MVAEIEQELRRAESQYRTTLDRFTVLDSYSGVSMFGLEPVKRTLGGTKNKDDDLIVR
jgi:hypothetical protein